MNYYNEWDKGAAAWLRELIKAGHLPAGIVDERSITEVKKEDLQGFTQCHFFAGIGGWSRALGLAGVSPETKLWTGSPPCQPFSVAGKQLAQDDPRHLAPAFLSLIEQCRPPALFGEQVAAAIGKHWLDDLFTELERQGYACGAAVLPACSVGAPHKRDRLFFGAVAYGQRIRPLRRRIGENRPGQAERGQAPVGPHEALRATGLRSSCELADADDAGSQGRGRVPERVDQQPAGPGSVGGSVAHTGYGARQPSEPRSAERGLQAGIEENAAFRPDPHHGYWSGADWLGCRDGKFRPVEPGTFPLANGIPARVGRLRGYGNAIVPQVAAEFIKAFTGAIEDVTA